MAGALWASYKDRLGLSEFIETSFDLASLIQRVQLLQLDDPFTHEEIEVVIRHVPPNHAP
jgi:hypothetical protein